MKKWALILSLCLVWLSSAVRLPPSAAAVHDAEASAARPADIAADAAADAVLAAAIDAPMTVDSGIEIRINGEPAELAAPPMLRGGSVHVPLASLLAELGVRIERDPQTGWLSFEHNGIAVRLKAGSASAVIDGRETALASPPVVASGYTYVPVRWLNEALGAVVTWHAESRTVSVYYPEQLPRVESLANLKKLTAEFEQRTGSSGIAAKQFARAAATADSASAAAASAPSGGYSGTNVQVQGVDEADVIKTDGRYIYQVSGRRVIITSAEPADQMSITAALSYEDDSFRPRELYVHPRYLVVIGDDAPETNTSPSAGTSRKMLYPIYQQYAKAIVYDIADKANPVQLRELELSGWYLSSRMIGDSLYLITNQYADLYRIMEGDKPALPSWRDSAAGNSSVDVGFQDIRYFPDFAEPNYLIIGSVDLSAEDPMDVQAYLGSGHNVYASAQHLYVAVSRFDHSEIQLQEPSSAQATIPVIPAPSRQTTDIYKFALQRGSVTYMAKGNVPGTIINQFAMDEYDRHFRIATTTGRLWGSGADISQNNLYVLDESLKQTGEIEGIAPGEQIYSVRFTGKRAYMVTFRTVDPLFVIDVADPANPAILGALKIPGYSDYLHPYDDNHLIGFGKDTTELKGNAYYLGMKVALFDVTDVTRPKELHKVHIGDRGTNSDLLYNHKALLFSREKNLLAFPVDLYEIPGGAAQPGRQLEHGVFAYQGAYVYSLTPEDGFQLRGRITHMTSDELAKSGNIWYGTNRVQRILYIGDTLYTVSNDIIKANRLSDLREIGSVHLK